MIQQFWSRFGVKPWSRHLFVAVTLVAAGTQPTPAADEADVDAMPEPRRVSRLIA